MNREPVFIGQINLAQNQRIDLELRTVKTERQLTFTPVDTCGEEPRRGHGGIVLNVSQIPQLRALLMNALSRALIDGPLNQKAAS